MNKLLGLLLLISIGFMAKLQNDLWQQQQRIDQLQASAEQSSRDSLQIKDQWVAWQRSQEQTVSTKSNPSVSNEITTDSSAYFKEQVAFIQFMLQQQQTVQAIQKMTELEQQLSQSSVAHRYTGLLLAVQKDKKQLLQYSQLAEQQLQQMNTTLGKIEQLIQQNIGTESNHLVYQSETQAKSLWQKLFIIERVKQPNMDQVYHQILLKEIQIELLLLKYFALHADDTAGQQQLNIIQQKVALLPAPLANTLQTEMNVLSSLLVQNIPQLTSLEILNQGKE